MAQADPKNPTVHPKLTSAEAADAPTNGITAMKAERRDDGFLELPRVAATELTYGRFLREFALPRQPFILTGVGDDWKAKSDWTGPGYFLRHGAVCREHEVTVAYGSDDHEATVGDALQQLEDRSSLPPAERTPRGPLYLSAWDYVRGGSGRLQEEIGVPSFFDRAPSWLSAHAVLGCATLDMKWLYVGEAGSRSRTHVDTNLSSAWLWVASGEKEWVCAHGDDCALVAGLRSAPSGASELDELELPDLFDPSLFAARPELASARLYRGTQRAGEVCFNPSRCVHAVRNLTFTISLTHNFIDATNLADAATDCAHSIRAELLPMVAALGAKKVARTLQRSLHVEKKELMRAVRSLPGLLDGEAVEDVIASAAGAEGGEEEADEVRALLRTHLARELEREGLRHSFRAAATELCDALGAARRKDQDQPREVVTEVKEC